MVKKKKYTLSKIFWALIGFIILYIIWELMFGVSFNLFQYITSNLIALIITAVIFIIVAILLIEIKLGNKTIKNIVISKKITFVLCIIGLFIIFTGAYIATRNYDLAEEAILFTLPGLALILIAFILGFARTINKDFLTKK